MGDMPWRAAIDEVLREEGGALHYAEIAERIVDRGLRESVGATPHSTVNALISTSLKNDGPASPYLRVGRGEYMLRERETKSPDGTLSASALDKDGDNPPPVCSFGMYWDRAKVHWTSNPKLLAIQQSGADRVDMSGQKGVYLLHDHREVIYVGRSIDRLLGARLWDHTRDRLSSRWQKFSWFGTRPLKEDGELDIAAESIDSALFIVAMEALLIEAVEPRQNRRQGDGFKAAEFLQVEDPHLESERKRRYIQDLVNNQPRAI